MSKLYKPSTKNQEEARRFVSIPPSAELPLPCLYSNNSIEPTHDNDRVKTVVGLISVLTPYHKKQAHTLYKNVERLIKTSKSLSHCGFLTLTFPDNVKDSKEAYDRFRSMNTNYLSKSDKFFNWIMVKERQKRGAWHFHLVIQLSQDIRSGFDFSQVAQGKYHSANSFIRSLWNELRQTLPKYGFGRSELLPIRTDAQCMGRYIGKYISKQIGNRKKEDKGVRLVTYSKNWPKNSVRFAWNTDGASEWRRKLKVFATVMGCEDFYDLNKKFGSSWAWKYSEIIKDIDSYTRIHEVPF